MSLDLGVPRTGPYYSWVVSELSPRWPISCRIIAILATLVVALSSILLSPLQAEDPVDALPILEPRALAPTLPGAPFLPTAARTDLVLARRDVLLQLDSLEQANAALSIRSAVDALGPDATTGHEDTQRVLSSQVAALERQLQTLEAEAEQLLGETAPFGIDIAVFPVASLRKPFFNDWGRPRSGGRSHQGTDLLAQIGVELRAIEDGTVERITNGSLGGLSIYLLGDSGSRYYYAHLDEVEDLQDGDRIYAGQAVGTIGDSGNARGAPHLHMQWDPNGESSWENPFPLLDVLFGEGAAAEAMAAIDEVPALDPSLLLLNADG